MLNGSESHHSKSEPLNLNFFSIVSFLIYIIKGIPKDPNVDLGFLLRILVRHTSLILVP